MPKPKYALDMAARPDLLLPDAEAERVVFNLDRLNPVGRLGHVKSAAIALAMRLVLLACLRLNIRPRVAGLTLVTRHADVCAVLADDQTFSVPFNAEMTRLADGATFMLGMTGPEHQARRQDVQDLLGSAVLDDFLGATTVSARAILAAAPGDIDVMADYFTRVCSDASSRFLGIDLADPDRFSAFSIAISALVFGDPFGKPEIREQASHAALMMRRTFDAAIMLARANPGGSGLLPQLLALQATPPRLAWSDADIRAHLMGLHIGIVPTVTLMAGNILSWLQEQPDVMAEAQASARAAAGGDAGAAAHLRALLLEVARLRPALYPGQFRLVTRDTELPGGLFGPTRLKADSVVMVGTAMALIDTRHYPDPDAFRPGRPLDRGAVNLIFGALPHECLGREMAIGQLVILFRELLAQANLRPAPGAAGRVYKAQAFPRRQNWLFDRPATLGPRPLPPFRLDDLAPKGVAARLAAAVQPRLLRLAGWLSRLFGTVIRPDWPTPVQVVAAPAAVATVRGDGERFVMPHKAALVALQDGLVPDRAHLDAMIDRALAGEDQAALEAEALRVGAALLANADGAIEVMRDYLWRSAAEIAVARFGLVIDNVPAFAEGCLAVANHLHHDPCERPVARAAAQNAASRIQLALDTAIDAALVRPGNQALLLDRLLAQTAAPGARPTAAQRALVRAALFEISVDFIAGIAGAGGAIMAGLARDTPGSAAAAVAAAEPGDALAALLARRWDANGRASPWRQVAVPTHIAGVAVAPGCWVLVLAPGLAAAAGPVSLPDGAADRLGLAVLTGLFRPLVQQAELRPHGRILRIGHYHSQLQLRFRAPGSEKHVGFVVVPIAVGIDPADVQVAATALGHPANPAIAARLDATGIVHFASLAIVESDRPALILEITVDGPLDAALASVATAMEAELRDLLAIAGHAPAGGTAALTAFLVAHLVKLHGKPWGATGLTFQGLPQLPVARIRAARALAARARALLEAELATGIGQGSRAMALLGRVRQALRAEADPALAAALLIPAGRPLALARFRQPTMGAAFRRFLFTADALPLTLPVLLLWLTAGAGLWRLWAPAIARQWPWLLLIAVVGGALLGLVALTLLFIATRRALNALEASDAVDDSAASLDRVRAIAAVEDHPGYSQNHIFAWGTLKPGLFRVGLHALALWLIGLICTYYYRPGFVLTMGTIHAANWWRIPGTRTMAFHASYDGSWDSYLEDFITRVPSGQTGAWSNWVGFPRTRDLINEGARDGDRFKRWVRLQQRPAAFWYTAFQRQSAEQIRSDALIQHGLALASWDTEARDWLRLFGSRPRGADTIETDEVQSLVFEGLKRLPASTTLCLALPGQRRDLEYWLRALLGIDDGAALAADYRLRFGDTYANAEMAGGAAHAAYLALSAAGIAQVRDRIADSSDGQRAWVVPELLDSFPAAFRLGMAGRARILGDQGGAGWRWADGSGDAAVHGAPAVAEAVLLLYASDTVALDRAVAAHQALLARHGGAVRVRRDSWHGQIEHFGFRDGISQPVIRGTARHNGEMPDRDVVEAGEFLLGYASNQGYRPLGPLLRGEIDSDHVLPVAEPGALSGVPDFGMVDSANAARDFGRNGSFLVIRELEQHVDSFNAELVAQAERLASQYTGLDRVIGQAVTPDWLAAKLMGRWRDGRPLVGNPLPGIPAQPAALNDFSYGIDDPEGLACPFAAHIRRTNPRDSKNPGNALEQVITNRHRLLRRGRLYGPQDGPGERGMMFMALCANLERQFEFVQQTWMNAPAFHGLESEPDAFVGQVDAGHGPRCFTIPTAAGPVRLHGLAAHVTPRGGGYFFLPGRAALTFLAQVLG